MTCVCGSTYFNHVRTERDEQNRKLRLRSCRNCHAEKASIETEISVAAFWGAAVSHIERQRRWASRTLRRAANLRTCRFCQQQYYRGGFSRHVRTEPHIAALKNRPTEASRNRSRRSAHRHYWRSRGFEIAS